MLDPAERALLSRRTATAVLGAAGEAVPYVVCDDEEVAEWATAKGATVLWRPGLGLNAAVADAVATTIALGHDGAIVAHADLPLAHDLDTLRRADEIVLVPDRVLDGTNVIALPRALAASFAFDYGPRSFERHLVAAHAISAAVRVVRDERLALDVDTPDDLTQPALASLLAAVRRESRSGREGGSEWTPRTTPASHRP